jgi:hypothetical protein
MIFFAAPSAQALDTPFLTWETGKQQTIVIGGTTSPLNWKIELVGDNAAPIEFKGAVGTRKNFYIFSINLPKDLPVGSYVVQSTKPNGSKTIIAAINVIARTHYTITQIPTDLILLLIIFVMITTSLSVLRGQKFATLSFERGEVRDIRNPLYRIRSRRLASTGDSFARYIAHRDGEWLHLLSPSIWSITPVIGLFFGAFAGFSIHKEGNFPQGSIPIILAAIVLGALDATMGYALAIGFTFVMIAMGEVASLREFLAIAAFSMAWIAPAMLSSMFSIVLNGEIAKEEKRVSISKLINTLTGASLGAMSVILSVVLTDSLMVTNESNAILRLPAAGLVMLILVLKAFISSSVETSKETTQERLLLARVVSPGVAYSLSFAIFGIIFAWSKSFTISAIATIVMALPYFLLFIAFPGTRLQSLARIRRNVLIETAMVAGATYLIYFFVQLYPAETIQKSEAFILLGLIPVLLHGVFSLLHASAEMTKREVDNAQR